MFGNKINEIQFFKKTENWENSRTKCLYTDTLHFLIL